MQKLEVRQFACLSDNYGYLVHDPASGETAAIDTPDAEVYLREADTAGWSITQIWNTHHHWDHAGGNEALKAATRAKIIAPKYDEHRIPADQYVEEGDQVFLGQHQANILYTPGHTLGHIVFHFPDSQIAFVGDTLFALGCGRLFEGTPKQMWNSLQRLREWPDDTLIYCAHEYTKSNAVFAQSIEADNAALAAYAAEVMAKRSADEPTVPTTIRREKEANPFLRADTPELASALGKSAADPVEIFADVRARKDAF